MGLWDLITVLGVFGTLGFIILSRLQKTNPKALDRLKEFMPGGEPKIEKEEEMKGKVERIYTEDRRML